MMDLPPLPLLLIEAAMVLMRITLETLRLLLPLLEEEEEVGGAGGPMGRI